MKKRFLIGATLIALFLSVSLLTVSVLAAMGQVFGVNNRIIFFGVDQYVHCIVDAEISGTTKDGDPSLRFEWEYNYADSDKDSPRLDWGIGDLEFNQKGVAPGQEQILYKFTVRNLSSDTKIRTYIEDPILDSEVLMFSIEGAVGSEKEIMPNTSAIVYLKLMPSNGEFYGAREFSITLHIEQI